MSLNFPGGPGDLQKLPTSFGWARALERRGPHHVRRFVGGLGLELQVGWQLAKILLVDMGDDGLLDRQREKMVAQRLGVRGCLAEVRGDWKFFKELFGFPGWNTNLGTCWLCKGTPGTLRGVGRGTQDAAKNVELSENSWCTLFSLASQFHRCSERRGSRTRCFRIEWLHCADMGVVCPLLSLVVSFITLCSLHRICQVRAATPEFTSFGRAFSSGTAWARTIVCKHWSSR